MQRGTLVILDRNWASYPQGTRFVVVQEVPCGEVQTTSGPITPINLRVVLEGEEASMDDIRAQRTIPAEYAVEVPRVGSAYDVEANQGTREGTVVATLGTQVLVEYEMPVGRTFGRIIDLLRDGWYRPVPMHNLPTKWKKEIAA